MRIRRFISIVPMFAVTLTIAGCAHLPAGKQQPFAVSKDGKAQARIVIAEKAPASTEYAAQELQKWLGEITGAQCEIVRDNVPVRSGEIVLGDSKHFRKLSKGKIDLASLGNEGYAIRSSSRYLIIAGGEPRGTLYGVYGLLEDHLGCRWFTTTVKRIPKLPTLDVPPVDETKVPALEYREPFVMDCFDGDWAARNRVNGNTMRLEEKHGGKVTYFGFVHTFESLLPPAQYYDAHPEYFSLVKGKRLKVGSQLCCTNEDVVRLVTEEVRKRMRENPGSTVFSVSQNDWQNYCECDKCTALATAEGSQMGPVLHLVNSVARAVAKEFPDKAVDTLAYQYTRKPTNTMRPEPNVIIRLCSIECCFSHPFETCDSPENKTFVEDVFGWSKISKRLWVWNYNTSFANYFCPYPNLHVRRPNIRFYAAHNVTGIFEQDTYTTLGGELSELSGYLNAKFLWDPEYPEEKAMTEFLEGVYGPAAKSIRNYIDLMKGRVVKDNIHMDIWIGPDHPLYTDELLQKGDALWDEAEKAVANQPEVLERVRIGRLPVDYAIIERARMQGAALYEIDSEAKTLSVKPDFLARTKRFCDVAKRNGVTAMREGPATIDTYCAELEQIQGLQAGPARRPVRVNSPKPGLAFREYEGSWTALPDFSKLRATHSGVAKEVSIKASQGGQQFGLTFTGFFRAPEDGVYFFALQSNDGSKMYLGKDTLIDNDGSHKSTTRPGVVHLKKGYHPVQIEYFQAGGASTLDLRCEGPGFTSRTVPPAMLWH
jgi:hypothetical protein